MDALGTHTKNSRLGQNNSDLWVKSEHRIET